MNTEGMDADEQRIADRGAQAALGLYNATLLASELLGLLLEPVRRTADRLTVRALVAEAESLNRRAARKQKA